MLKIFVVVTLKKCKLNNIFEYISVIIFKGIPAVVESSIKLLLKYEIPK